MKSLNTTNTHLKWGTVVILLSIIIAFVWPYDHSRLRIPDPWTYEVAAQNLSNRLFVLTNEQIATNQTYVRLAGGILSQYLEISDGRWVLRQSFGYPLLLAPFHKIGMPQLVNLVLAGWALWLTYRLLCRWFPSQTGIPLIGTLLLAWTPMTMLATHYIYMDTFAAGVLLTISGCLLSIWGENEGVVLYRAKAKVKKKKRGSAQSVASAVHRRPYGLLFAAGLTCGWAVVTRSSNLLPVLVLGSFFLYLVWCQWRLTSQVNWLSIASFALGGLIALTVLLAYNRYVFGGFFTTGYSLPIGDDIYYLWKGRPATEINGVETWIVEGGFLAIVKTIFLHIGLWSRPALLAWPILPITLMGTMLIFIQKRVTPLFVFLLLWILAVYVLYAGVVFFGVTRALTASGQEGWNFFVATRYLFPATWPFIILALDWISRWPVKAQYIFSGGYILVGLLIFVLAGTS